MSAWLCSEDHIALIVNATPNGTAEAFQMLVNENVRSLETRYPGRDFLKEWQDDAATYQYKREQPEVILARAFVENQDTVVSMNTIRGFKGKPPLDANNLTVVLTQIVKACDCFDYQACETEDYRSTDAAKYVDHIRRLAVEAGGDMKGTLYDQLLWGL